MQCAACGFVNQPGLKFCGQCGAALPVAIQTPAKQANWKPFIVTISLVVLAVVAIRVNASLSRVTPTPTRVPLLSFKGHTVKDGLAADKTCIAYWSANSSRENEKTHVSDVRALQDGTQFYVFHAGENKKIWVWEDRLFGFQCT